MHKIPISTFFSKIPQLLSSILVVYRLIVRKRRDTTLVLRMRTRVYTNTYFTETVTTPTPPRPLPELKRMRQGGSDDRLSEIRTSPNLSSK